MSGRYQGRLEDVRRDLQVVGGLPGGAAAPCAVGHCGLDGDLDTTADNGTFSRTFDVIVNSVNDVPTINAIADVTMLSLGRAP